MEFQSIAVFNNLQLYIFLKSLVLGGLNQSVFDSCLIGEELAYGCTGISTVLGSSGLGVSYC